MSLPELFANESLVSFGWPWHGLFVYPRSGKPYVRLASGRKIYLDDAPYPGGYEFDTYLVDLGLPEPAVQPDDPDARFWNRYIARSNGTTSTFSAWHGIRGARRVRVGDDFVGVYVAVTWVGPDYGLRIECNGLRYIEITLPAGPFQGLPARYSAAYAGSLLDVTPDGKRWLFALVYRNYYHDYPYMINLDRGDDERIGAIVEVELSDDLTTCTGRVLAGYEDCIIGRNATSQAGEPLQEGLLWVVTNGDGTGWMEWSEDSEPPYPYYPTTIDEIVWGPPPPYKWSISYSVGTSTAVASREFVVGGWYAEDGTPQLLRLKASVTSSITVQRPAPMSAVAQWWSPYTDRREYAYSVKIGDGPYRPLLEIFQQEEQSPDTTTITFGFAGHVVSRERENLPVGPEWLPVGEIVKALKPPQPEKPRLDGVAGSGYGDDGQDLRWRLGGGGSNKVYTALARVSRNDGTYFEYIAAPCVTPAGIVTGIVKSGNLVPGHHIRAKNFDQALWDYHKYFAYASYNPVTGEVERHRLGGDYFAWI